MLILLKPYLYIIIGKKEHIYEEPKFSEPVYEQVLRKNMIQMEPNKAYEDPTQIERNEAYIYAS